MQVSVVIPTRNRGALIKESIESVLSGDRRPDEIIVVDQSDDDATRAAVLEAGALAPGVVQYVRSNVRRGVSRARNEGVEASRGAMIAFTDDDVRVYRDWLARIEREFYDYPDLALLYGTVEAPPGYDWTREKVPYAILPTQRPVPRLWRGAIGVMSANMAVRRPAFDALGPFDVRLGPGTEISGEDIEYLFRALDRRPAVRVHTLGDVRVVHYAGARTGSEYKRFVRSMNGIGMGLFWAYMLRKARFTYTVQFLQDEMSLLGGYIRSLFRGRRPTGVVTHLYRLRGLTQGLLVGLPTGRTE